LGLAEKKNNTPPAPVKAHKMKSLFEHIETYLFGPDIIWTDENDSLWPGWYTQVMDILNCHPYIGTHTYNINMQKLYGCFKSGLSPEAAVNISGLVEWLLLSEILSVN
jgi:hypothetical protein